MPNHGVLLTLHCRSLVSILCCASQAGIAPLSTALGAAFAFSFLEALDVTILRLHELRSSSVVDIEVVRLVWWQ